MTPSSKPDSSSRPHLFTEEELKQCALSAEGAASSGPVTCLGHTFPDDEARRAYFRDELRKKLPELRKIEGFPIGEDDDIINLSDPPYYTACPNPWLNDFIAEWEQDKQRLEAEGKRSKDFEVKEPYASDVSEGKNNPVYNAHSYHTKVPHPAIMRYILHYTQPGDIVFDGFAGTGMTGVAAGRCSKNELKGYEDGIQVGRRFCILGDLSPIASFIGYNFNNPISNPKDIMDLGRRIIARLRGEFAYLYETKHSNGLPGEIVYVIWSDVLICPNCAAEFSYWKASFADQKRAGRTMVCPKCGAMVKKSRENIVHETVLLPGEISTRVPRKVPVLICYKYNGVRYFKKPDMFDLDLVQGTKMLRFEHFYPIDDIPSGVKTSELRSLGYSNVSQLYTKRNLFVFSALWHSMRNYPILRFALTSILVKTGSLLHNVGVKAGKINLAGALPNALFVPSVLAERNIFQLLDGKLRDIEKMNPEELHRSCVQVQSATDLANILDNSIDYIFTDPPFGSNLMYSELNFIHECWLRVKTDNEEEAIENSVQHKSVNDYTELMTKAFQEYYRILKPGKWMTVEFSNTSASVWNAIQRSLTKASFVISVVRGLDKKQGSYNAQTSLTAVKQDLVISCYKKSDMVERTILLDPCLGTWSFMSEQLDHLPVVYESNGKLINVVERTGRLLYDRLVSICVEKGMQIPYDSSAFQAGLRERYIERDGMFFTPAQAVEYDQKKAHAPEMMSLAIIVSNEVEGIEWLKRELQTPKTYQEIQPEWLQSLGGVRKGDKLPELVELLEENFIQESDGKWRLPNIHDDKDLEALRTKTLLREFNYYVAQIEKSKGKLKLKEVRVEALRTGFKDCYVKKDFQTIVTVGDRIPQNLRDEDEVLLQFYDIALNKL